MMKIIFLPRFLILFLCLFQSHASEAEYAADGYFVHRDQFFLDDSKSTQEKEIYRHVLESRYQYNNVLVISSGPRVYGIDLNTGTTIWSKWETFSGENKFTGIGDLFIYVASDNGDDLLKMGNIGNQQVQ